MYWLHHRRWACPVATCVLMVALAGLPGCSLISLRSPAKPLTERELSVRLATHDYAQNFAQQVSRAADQIAAGSADAQVRVAALRWKIEAASASRYAATQLSPELSLLDTWALAAQMNQFFESGPGAALFGPQQDIARSAASGLERDFVERARALTSPDRFSEYQAAIANYVRESPLMDLGFARPPIVNLRPQISTVGTMPQVMSDLADRLRLYSDQVPSETLWRMQLGLREAGYGTDDWRYVMDRMDVSLDKIGNLAEASPALLRDSLADFHTNLAGTADRLDVSWERMMVSVRTEREALTRSFEQERAAISDAANAQRIALAQDASRVAVEVTESAGAQIRALIREIVIYGLAAVLVLFSLPFAVGFYLGRASQRLRSAR